MTGCEGSDEVVVAINRADDARPVTLPVGSYTDLLTSTPYAGGSVTLPARSFVVLAPGP
jgi:beta-galactosidase GanA